MTMPGDDDAGCVHAEVLDTLLDQYRELEMTLALLVAKYGEPTQDGYCLHLDIEEALSLRRRMPKEAVILQTFDVDECRYVLDVL